MAPWLNSRTPWIRRTDPGNFVRRYQHLFAGEPVADFDDQFMNRPAFIVHHKIADVADDPSLAWRW